MEEPRCAVFIRTITFIHSLHRRKRESRKSVKRAKNQNYPSTKQKTARVESFATHEVGRSHRQEISAIQRGAKERLSDDKLVLR